jgi:hypothetical protein
MHLAEEILLPQPLTFGGDYRVNGRLKEREIGIFVADLYRKHRFIRLCGSTSWLCAKGQRQ